FIILYAHPRSFRIFFFMDTACTQLYTLSLHDALPIYQLRLLVNAGDHKFFGGQTKLPAYLQFTRRTDLKAVDEFTDSLKNKSIRDRKSTRLNSSHVSISYAVFCLKKEITSVGVFAQSV